MQAAGRAGRTEDDLPHPDKKTVTADDANGDYRPYSESQDEEGQQLGPSSATQIIPAGHFEGVLDHGTAPSTSANLRPANQLLQFKCAATFSFLVGRQV
jgi:hypothetical protein